MKSVAASGAFAAALLLAGVSVAQDQPGHAAHGAPAAPAAKTYSVASPIETLANDPASKAVLDKHLPGMLAHPQYNDFKAMTLEAVIPYSGGHVTPEVIAKIESDLQALPKS
jgi:hypothetical protein